MDACVGAREKRMREKRIIILDVGALLYYSYRARKAHACV